MTRLLLTHNGESRSVTHYHFVSWPDYGVPDSAMSMLTFLQRVRETQADMTARMSPKWKGHPLGPPMVVHCSVPRLLSRGAVAVLGCPFLFVFFSCLVLLLLVLLVRVLSGMCFLS